MSRNNEDILRNPNSIGYFVASRNPMGHKNLRVKATRVCPCCKKEYIRYASEIEYEIDLGYGTEPIVLCSHNCKHRYLREHYDDIEKKRKKYAKKYEKTTKPQLI